MYYKIYKNHTDMYHDLINTGIGQGAKIELNNLMVYELNHIFSVIENPLQRCEFQSPTSMFFDMVETIFVLSGRKDSYLLKQYKPEMSKYEENGVFEMAEGPRLFNGLYGNQIKKIVDKLKHDRNSRNLIGIMNEVEVNYEPCTMYFQFTVIEEKINLYVNFRALDPIRYLNRDFFLYSVLLELVANWVEIPIGKLIIHSNNLHIYEHLVDRIKLLQKRGGILKYPNKQINFPLRISIENVNIIFSKTMDILIKWHKFGVFVPADSLKEIYESGLPPCMQHWLKILLCGRYMELKQIENIKIVLENTEDTDLKRSIVYFLNNKTPEILEIRGHVMKRNLSGAIKRLRKQNI